MKKIKVAKTSWMLIIGFIGLVGLLGTGLSLNPRFLPSKMVNKPFPEFALEDMANPRHILRRQDVLGRPAMVHIWATWCGVCLNEHSTILQISHRWPFPIYSVLYQDSPIKAESWLRSKGNPYAWTAIDNRGRLGVELGVYGTPETYVVDGQGTIRYRLVGPLSVSKFERDILPLLQSLD